MLVRLALAAFAIAAALCTGPATGAESAPRARPAVATEICGSPSLTGTIMRAISEGDCGIEAPVRVDTAAGVALDPPPTLDCAAATALDAWLRLGPKATFAALGHRVDGLIVADAYSCRNRNRTKEGKLSEHAFGRAIDIAAFRLDNGSRITVSDGWADATWGPPLRRIHDAACGPFATVLGPEANSLHADHIHLDAAPRRYTPWCE